MQLGTFRRRIALMPQYGEGCLYIALAFRLKKFKQTA